MPRSCTSQCGASLLCALIALHAPARVCAADSDLSELDLGTLMNMDVTLVTAQKRSENVNTVPISMTVLTADAVHAANLSTTSDLQAASPGLTTTQNAGWMLPFIRGVGNDISSSGIEPSVAVYVDGVYQAERVLTLVDLADVEQIEVLRGPQGTLYGRNATGGAINIVTRGPTESFQAAAAAGTGNLNLREGNVFVGGPLSDRMRVSFAGNARNKEGYYTNLFDGRKVNAENFYSLHGRAQLDITDALRTEVMIKYFSRDESGIFGTQASANSIPRLLGIPEGRRPYETVSEQTGNADRLDTTTVALKLNWDAPAVSVQSLTAYSEQNHRIAIDFDASAALLTQLTADETNRALTQEFQFSPAQKFAPLDWLFGAFYIDSSGGFLPIRVATTVPLAGPLTQVIEARVDTQAWAAFGEATYALSSTWSLTGGLRYSYEEKELVDTAAGIAGMPLQSFPDRSHSWNDANYRLVLKYAKDRTMLYAKTETGFKSGVYNNANPFNPGPVDPEQITAYEVGVKSGIAELPIRVGLAAFYNDYRDLQIQIVDTLSGATLIVQAPKAETYGIDASVEWRAHEHLNLNAGFGWLRAEYLEFVSSGVLVPSPFGGNEPSPGLNMAGNSLSRSPELTANVGATFTYPLGPGELTGAANYYRSSRIYFDPANAYSQDAYGLVSARFGYRSRAGWSALAWGKNLTDEVYFDSIVPGVLGAFGQYAEPRTYGVTVGYSFGH